MEALTNFTQNPIFVKLVNLLFWLIVILLCTAFLRKILKKRIEDTSIRYKAQKGVEIVGYLLIGFMVLISVTVENIEDFTLIIGLFTAGITFTLQELVLSIAGSFYIFFVRVYKPGDRIEINGIKGDVIDIDSIYTTIMEMGEWVSSDNYSGRIVKISNAFVFKGPIKNYSMDFPFVWDELNVFVTYDSDLQLAKNIVLEKAREQLSDYTEQSEVKWKEMVQRYYIENAKLQPSLSVGLTDNWIQINLRYITDYKLRRATKDALFQRIQIGVAESSGRVKLASTTLQLLKIPEIDVYLKNQNA